MKALQTCLALAVLMLLPQSLFSQGAGHAVPSMRESSNSTGRSSDMAPMRQMMELHQKMQAEMQATDGQLDALLAEMNGSTGEKKVEAIAALLNRLMQERKAMQHRMAEMHMQMMGGLPGPAGEGTSAAPERMAAREMQQRLAAERDSVEAQMEAQQRQAEAQRGAQRALLEQREKMEQALNQARQEAERAVAQAREEVAKATAEREAARKQTEEAVVEARSLADRAAAARAEAEKAIAEAREAERAARQQAEAERARRDAEKEKK